MKEQGKMETVIFDNGQTFNCDIVVAVKQEPVENLTGYGKSTGLENHTKIKEETEVDVVSPVVEADSLRIALQANDQVKDLEDGFIVDIIKTEDVAESDTIVTKNITDGLSAEPSVGIEIPVQRDEMFTKLKSVQTQLESMNQEKHQIVVNEHIQRNYDYIVKNVDHNYAKKLAVDAGNETASQGSRDMDLTNAAEENDDNFTVLAEWSIEKEGETPTPGDENTGISGSFSKGSFVRIGACSRCDAHGYTIKSGRLVNSADGHRCTMKSGKCVNSTDGQSCTVRSGGLVNSTDGQSCTVKSGRIVHSADGQHCVVNSGRLVNSTDVQSSTVKSGRLVNSTGIITQKSTIKRKIQEDSATLPSKVLIMANHSGKITERQCIYTGSASLDSGTILTVDPFPGLNTGSFQVKAIGNSPSSATIAPLDNTVVSSCTMAKQCKLVSSVSQTPPVNSNIPMEYSQEFQPETSESILKQMPTLTNYAEATQKFRNCSVEVSNVDKDTKDSISESNRSMDIATVDSNTSFDRYVPSDQHCNADTEHVSDVETWTHVDNDITLNGKGSWRDQNQIIIEPLTEAALSEPGHADDKQGLISYSGDVDGVVNKDPAILSKPVTGDGIDCSSLETRKLVYPGEVAAHITRSGNFSMGYAANQKDVYSVTPHACLYCGKLFEEEISEHLASEHGAELDVKMAMSKKQIKRRAAFEKLTRYGNFKHNIGVLKSQQGNLIIDRRPTFHPEIFWIFLPCIYCLNFYPDQKLGVHCKKCPFQPTNQSCYYGQNSYFIQKAKLLIKYISDARYISDQNEEVQNNLVHSGPYNLIKYARKRIISLIDAGEKYPHLALGSSFSALSKCRRKLVRSNNTNISLRNIGVETGRVSAVHNDVTVTRNGRKIMTKTPSHEDGRPNLKSVRDRRTAEKGTDRKMCVYTDMNVCLYCDSYCGVNIEDHLVEKHRDKPEVIDALAKSDKDRELSLKKLQHKGNYKHNVAVLKSGQGHLPLILATKPSCPVKMTDCAPCSYCLAYFSRDSLKEHKRECLFEPRFIQSPRFSMQQAKRRILGDNFRFARSVGGAMFLSPSYREELSVIRKDSQSEEKPPNTSEGGRGERTGLAADKLSSTSTNAQTDCELVKDKMPTDGISMAVTTDEYLDGDAMEKGQTDNESSCDNTGTSTGKNMCSDTDVNVCLYCDSYCRVNIEDHLVEKHRDKPEVIDALAKSDKDRELSLKKLQYRGNYKHNVAVLKSGVGDLVLVTKPKVSNNKMDYVPCSYCLAYFSRNSLKNHQQDCLFLTHLKPGGWSAKQQAKISILEDNFRFAQSVGGAQFLSLSDLERMSVLGKTGSQTEETSPNTSACGGGERSGLAVDGVSGSEDNCGLDNTGVDIPGTPADSKNYDDTVKGTRSGRKIKAPKRYGRFLVGEAAESKMMEEIDDDMDIDYDDDQVDQSYIPKEEDGENDEVTGESDHSDGDSETEQKILKEGIEESAKSSSTSKRVPKCLRCCFCDKLIKGKIMRHMLRVHKKHEQVKPVLKLSKGSPERKKLLGFLLTEVYFKHNKKVLETGNGELIVHKKLARLPATDFILCERCKQLIQTKKWKTHETVCMSHDDELEEFLQCLGDAVADESESNSDGDEDLIVEENDNAAGKSQTSPLDGTTETPSSSHTKKRVRKSKSCCFCGKLIRAKLVLHILRVHRKHEQVKPIHKFPKGSPERKKLTEFLMKEAYFKHNKKVLETGVGELTLFGRLGPRPPSDFSLCERCKKVILTKNWETHKDECVSHKDELSKFMQSLGDIVTDKADSNSDSDGELIEEDDHVTEEDIDYVAKMLENAPPRVTVPTLANEGINSSRHEERKSKPIFCTFCGKEKYYHMSHHFYEVHKRCKRVAELLKLPKGSRERFIKLQILLNEGNFKHNMKVLKRGEGCLVVRKRDRKVDVKPSDFYPCRFCQNLVRNKYLHSDHERHCVVKQYIEGVPSGQKKIGNTEKMEDENMKDYSVTRDDVVEMTALLGKYTEAASDSEGPVNVTLTDRKKGHYCLFCHKVRQCKIARHIIKKHHTIDRVAEIAHLPKFSKERSAKLDNLLREGDFKYNMKVLKAGKGEIIVSRSNACLSSQSPADYFCCLYCKKFLLRTSVWNHRLKCKARKTVISRQLTNIGDDAGDVDASVPEAAVGIFMRQENAETTAAGKLISSENVTTDASTIALSTDVIMSGDASYLAMPADTFSLTNSTDGSFIRNSTDASSATMTEGVSSVTMPTDAVTVPLSASVSMSADAVTVPISVSSVTMSTDAVTVPMSASSVTMSTDAVTVPMSASTTDAVSVPMPAIFVTMSTDALTVPMSVSSVTMSTDALTVPMSVSSVTMSTDAVTVPMSVSSVTMSTDAVTVPMSASSVTMSTDVYPAAKSADASPVTTLADVSTITMSANTCCKMSTVVATVTKSAHVSSVSMSTDVASETMTTDPLPVTTSSDVSTITMPADTCCKMSTDVSTVTQSAYVSSVSMSTDVSSETMTTDAPSITMANDAFSVSTDILSVTKAANVTTVPTSTKALSVFMSADTLSVARPTYTSSVITSSTDTSSVAISTNESTGIMSAVVSSITMATDVRMATRSSSVSVPAETEQVLHSCIFCGKLHKRGISLHFQRNHKDKKSVSSILLLGRTSLERKLKYTLLINLGDFKYNMEVLKSDPENLTVKLDSSDAVKGNLTPADFIPCEYCKRFIWKKWTLCHGRKCKIKKFYDQFGLGNFTEQVEAERVMNRNYSEESLTADAELLNSRRPYTTVQHCHLCAFCGKKFGRCVANHLRGHHKDVECARATLQLPKGSDERLIKFMLLWTLGNYRHNMNVLRTGQGTLLTSVNSQKGLLSQTELRIPADFVVCKYCKKFVEKFSFWRHDRLCKAKEFYEQFDLEKFSEEVVAEAEKISKAKLEARNKVTIKVMEKHMQPFHYCTFCGEEICHSHTKHFITHHKDDERVSQITKLPKDSEERKVRLSVLLYDGDYKHNLDVIKKGCGEFIVTVGLMGDLRPDDCTLEDFIACEHCKRFMSKKLLQHHKYSCKVKKFFQPQRIKVLNKASDGKREMTINVLEKHGANEPIFHYCTFCGEKVFGRIKNHLITDHKDEEHVRQITDLPQDSKERKVRLSVLMHDGDYNHNMNVMKNGCGEFIILKSLMGDLTLEDCTLEDFAACDHCKRFMNKKLVHHHQYSCRVKKFFVPPRSRVLVKASEVEQRNQSMVTSQVKCRLLRRLTTGKAIKKDETEVQELPVERRVLPVRAARTKSTATKVQIDDADDRSKADDGDEDVDVNSEEVGLDDSDADSDYDFKRDVVSDPDYKQDLNLGKVEKTIKFAKHRWTEEENVHFCRIFAENIKERTMPTRSLLDEAVRLIKNRTILQIRTRVHNIIKHKQKKYK